MSELRVEVLVLSKSEIERLVSYKEVLESVELSFKAYGTGELIQPQKDPMYIDGERHKNFLIAAPAFVKSLATAGIKWNCVYGNQKPGFPVIGATVILNDVETGMPIAFMDGISITTMRTAGHSAVAAKYLAKKESSIVALIGCGAEARTHLSALNELFPLKTVKVFDIRPEAMGAFKQEMYERFSVDIVPTKSIQEAVTGTDIVCVLTTSPKPVVFEQWIPSGCFVSGIMGFYDLDPMITKKADKWVLGHRESDKHLFVGDGLHLGDGITMQPSMDDVYGDMGEITTGAKPGRQNNQERNVYTHAGMGSHDVAVAMVAYRKAKEKGVGTTVRLI